MRITRISRLRGCGVFRNFTWPSDLLEFGRYNLIYGWNWSGKTTLSRLFRDLELCRCPTMGEAVLRIGSSNLRGENFPQSSLQVRVFNRDFIDENVFPVVSSDMPPIFVLGKESVEKQKKVENLKKQRVVAQSNLANARSAGQTASGNFDQYCIDRARFIKNTLRSSGQNPYNNYNKSTFRDDSEKMVETGDSITHRLNETEGDGLRTQHRATLKQKVVELNYALPEFNTIMGCLSELLMTTVVSAAIDALKDDPTLANWSRQGLALHRNRKAERCLFCEQPLTEARLADLEAHFSAQYDQFIQRIDQEIDKLKGASEVIANLRPPTITELYDDLGPEFQTREAKLQDVLKSAHDFLDQAVKALMDKKSRVFENVKLELEAPHTCAGAVEKLNAVIREHNQACDEFENRVEEARRKLADDMIEAGLEEFVHRRNVVDHAKADLLTREECVKHLNHEIAQLEREIVEHRQPAEELNEDLHKYLGHQELTLKINETGYTITRGGVPAQNLSEGEITAISLLYFLKSLRDTRFELASGVIVLDDPVSSLDANALFLAFGIIRERTKDAGQLFVFTHNFAFFRQIRNWFHHLKRRNKKNISQRPARFFMLDSVLEENARSSAIRPLDPLLERYESEYQYLFARVQRASTELASQGLEQNYVLPNMARRMLEAFLAFRQPHITGGLWRKLEEVPFDEAKKSRIIRFLNTFSHSIAVGEPEHDLTALAEGPAVLKDLLAMIESLDRAHFLAMMQLVAPPADSGEAGDDVVTA